MVSLTRHPSFTRQHPDYSNYNDRQKKAARETHARNCSQANQRATHMPLQPGPTGQPNSPANIGSAFAQARTDAYNYYRIPAQDEPPGMPTPRDRDSEKIVFSPDREAGLHPVSHNLPLRPRRTEQPISPENIGSAFAQARTDAYNYYRIPEQDEPPGMPTPRDLDSEKIVFSPDREAGLHPVSHNPPLPLAQRQATGQLHSPASIGGSSAAQARTSVYRHMNVDENGPPGMPTPGDLDSEKILYSPDRESGLHTVSQNPLASSHLDQGYSAGGPSHGQPVGYSSGHIPQNEPYPTSPVSPLSPLSPLSPESYRDHRFSFTSMISALEGTGTPWQVQEADSAPVHHLDSTPLQEADSTQIHQADSRPIYEAPDRRY